MIKKMLCLAICVVMTISVSACASENKNKFYGETSSGSTAEDDGFTDITKTYDLNIPNYKDYFKLGQYKDLTYYINDADYVVNDAAIDKMILNELNIEPKSITDRPAQKDDTVTISFIGKIDGKTFSGGTVKDTTIIIGQQKLPKEFEDQLIGFKSGETKPVDYTFPADYADETVAGKTATFDVTMSDIKAYNISIVTDDIIKEKTDCETLDEYRKQACADIEKELAAKKKTDAAAILMSQALKNSEVIGYDTEMVNDLIGSAKFATEHKAKQAGITNDEYCQQAYGMSYDEYAKGLEKTAHDYLDSVMTISAIAYAEDIKVTDEEYQAQIQKFRDSGLSAKDISEGYTVHDIAYSILVTKVQDWMLDHATKSDTPIS